MSTLLDVISGALTAIGQLGQGQTPSSEDAALGLRLVNLLLQKWTTQRLYLPYVSIREYALQANTVSYTIGPSGTLGGVAVRPVFIESAQINVVGSSVWLPLNILEKAQWDAIRNKGAKADIPDEIYPSYEFPNVQIYFNPAPLGTPLVRLGCWEPLVQFVSLVDQILFPPGYEEFFEASLAVVYAPYYDQPVPQNLAARAADASTSLMKINAQGLGGALGESQKLQSPNVGQPIPGGQG